MASSIPLAVSAAGGTVIGASITAVLAAAVALYLNAIGRKNEDRSRRRGLYSEAYRTALEWCEGVYRVRRRAPDKSQDRELVAHFHDLQERIAYYQGWLSIESASLGTSYQQFVEAVMKECRPLIREAWNRDGRDPTAPTPPDECDPQLDDVKATFLREVREHLKRWWETI